MIVVARGPSGPSRALHAPWSGRDCPPTREWRRAGTRGRTEVAWRAVRPRLFIRPPPASRARPPPSQPKPRDDGRSAAGPPRWTGPRPSTAPGFAPVRVRPHGRSIHRPPRPPSIPRDPGVVRPKEAVRRRTSSRAWRVARQPAARTRHRTAWRPASRAWPAPAPHAWTFGHHHTPRRMRLAPARAPRVRRRFASMRPTSPRQSPRTPPRNRRLLEARLHLHEGRPLGRA